MTSAVPDATRARRAGWRDPRLLAGVALVAVCMLAGGWLMAGLDDTVGVWALRRDLPAGAAPSSSDLEVRQVRFADAEAADRYLAATEQPPSGQVALRPVGAGELLPRAALGEQTKRDLVELPLSIQYDDLPATVRVGSVVDVWVVPPEGSQTEGRATAVLREVSVLGLPRSADAFSGRGTRQVIVGAPTGDHALDRALGAIATGRVVLTRRP